MCPDDVTGADEAGTERTPEENLIPGWLALLVLVLLLAVVGVGGYIVRDMMSGERYTTPQDAEVTRAEAEVRSKPEDVDTRRNLAYAYQQAKRYDKAIEVYDQVLKLAPKDPASLYNKGAIYLELQANDRAEEVLWDVLEEEPTHVLAAKALGEYYASRGQYKSVLVAVRPVVKVKPEMADLQYLMGLSYENTGHAEWAEARYRLALKYVPDMPKARDALARLEKRK